MRMSLETGKGRFTLYGAALALALLGLGGTAWGAACTTAGFGGTDISGKVVTNSGCEVGTTGNDSPTGPTWPSAPSATAQVNVDTMVGFSDWVFLSKTEFSTPGPTSGSWNLGATLFSTFDRALLVFKDGEGNCVPCTYVGYLILAANGTSGTWTTMFRNLNNGNLKEISHISIYVHPKNGGGPGPSPVPIPGALILMLSALGSLGLFGWWRRRATV